MTKRLTSLPELRQIGFSANRRLLGVQTISHDPIRGAQAFHHLTAPIVEENTRIPGLRFGDARVHALLQALLVHRLLVDGFTNRDLRTLIAPLLGTRVEDITAGQMTYDLRRLRAHGLIERVPRTRRYTVTETGLYSTRCCSPTPRPPAARRARPGRRPQPTTNIQAAQRNSCLPSRFRRPHPPGTTRRLTAHDSNRILDQNLRLRRLSFAKRLLHTYGNSILNEFKVDDIPPDVAGARALFAKSPFDFERWAVSLINENPIRSR